MEPALRGLDVKELLTKGEATFDTDFDPEAHKAGKEEVDFNDFLDHYADGDCLEDDFEPGVTPYETLGQEMTDIFDGGKIKKKILSQGAARIADKSLVFVHYNFFIEYQPEPFDSSYLRQKNPFKIKLGSDSLVVGFEIAVKSMLVNERARFLVHPDYAFRERGVLGRIPPNATVLMDIKVFKAVDRPLDLDEEEPTVPVKRGDFSATYRKATELLRKGRACYAENSLPAAVTCFEKASRLLLPCSLNNDDEERRYKKLLMKLYTNLAICYQNSKKPELVCVTFQKARNLDVAMAFKNAKLLYQRALALSALLDYESAEKNFRYALQLEPRNQEIHGALEALWEKKADRESNIQFLREAQEADGSAEAPEAEDDSDDPAFEIDEESKMAARQVFEEFALDNQPLLELSSGYTKSERRFFESECARLRLLYKEEKRNNQIYVVIGNRRIF